MKSLSRNMGINYRKPGWAKAYFVLRFATPGLKAVAIKGIMIGDFFLKDLKALILSGVLTQ